MKRKDELTFKRLEIGQKFSSASASADCPTGNFRKVSSKEAIRLNDNGTGQTHNKIVFSRSCAVKVVN